MPRQLPPACYWLDHDDGSYLRWNYATVAYVKPEGWRWRTTINWTSRQYTALSASRAQGKRWVERWVSAQKGSPRAKR